MSFTILPTKSCCEGNWFLSRKAPKCHWKSTVATNLALTWNRSWRQWAPYVHYLCCDPIDHSYDVQLLMTSARASVILLSWRHLEHQGYHAPLGRNKDQSPGLSAWNCVYSKSGLKSSWACEICKAVHKKGMILKSTSCLHGPSFLIRAESFPYNTPLLVKWISWVSWNLISSLLHSYGGLRMEFWLLVAARCELPHVLLSCLQSKVG